MLVEEFRGQLHEGEAGAGLNDEVVADQRANEGIEMSPLRFGQSVHELLLLPLQQPAELLRALRDGHRQRLHAAGREKRDQLRP